MRLTAGCIVMVLLAGCVKPSEEELRKNAVESQMANDYDASLGYYEQLLADYPQGESVPEALYAMGSIYQGVKSEPRKAIDVFRRLLAGYPDHPTTPNAMFMIGFIYNNDLNMPDSAKPAFEAFLLRYPDNPLSESARFELEHLGKDAAEIFRERTAQASGTRSMDAK